MLTFWGKPRNQHLYDHAHEAPLMYVPLVVLAAGLAGAVTAAYAPALLALKPMDKAPPAAPRPWGATLRAVLTKHGAELSEDERKAVQQAIDDYFPYLPAFFGRPGSRNNEIYRRWGIKLRSNEEMRDDYLRRARELVEGLGLKLPEVKLEPA